MNKSKKTILIFLVLIIVIAVTIGVTYAFFNYTKVSTKSHSIIAGSINLTYNEETDTLSLTNAFPETKEEARLRDDNYITFTISGLNTSSKDINYEIDLIHGSEFTGKTRFEDNHLKFDLEETIGGNTTLVVNNMSYQDLTNYLSIWVNHVDGNTSSTITRTYKLRMWISDSVTISDSDANASYTTSEYHNLYASIKVRVIGDFNEHDYVKNATQMLIANALPSTTSSEFVTNANGIDYGNISSDTNGKGLYILKGTESDEYPIAFFRGEINNNNVIFGGFCWQIVRTTDTGGIKMIYNGVATGNGTTCENTAHADRIISSSKFNANSTSMSDVGYMYNTRYASSIATGASNLIFGKNVEWDGSNYLVIEDTSGMASTNETLDADHHYTCGSAGTSTCTSVRYYYYSGSDYYYITLTSGDTIEDAIYKMTGNGSSETITKNDGYVLNNTDSTIKTTLETWFRNNLNDYINYLEDTTWCNDRTFKTSGGNSLASSGWNPSGGSLSTTICFGTRNRVWNSWYSTTNVPVTTCEREIDSFRVNNSQAPLTYPIGLLTADEVIMGGASGNGSTVNSTYYLYTGNNYWLAAPFYFFSIRAYEFEVNSSGNLYYFYVSVASGLRGAVSLALGTEFVDGGDGTPENPYVVKYD